jgi:DNA-binding CsgD family transcriptional regulator
MSMELLRIRDVRNALRLISDCRDLGHDPDLWHQRMFEGLLALIGCSGATGGEGLWNRPHQPPQPMTAFDVGLDQTARKLSLAYMQQGGGFAQDPIMQGMQGITDHALTRTRGEVVSDQNWYRSPSFNEYRKPGRIDDQLTSIYQVDSKGAINAITLHRPLGDRPFSMRERHLLDVFHGEVGRLIGKSLVSGTEPGPKGLSPRLRQTLTCLIEGDSEKQLAARLGVSCATAHQYVTSLYRLFDVKSRGQLMAFLFKRIGTGHWKLLSGSVSKLRTDL